jgi:predicted RNase H-like HicB family nuclease
MYGSWFDYDHPLQSVKDAISLWIDTAQEFGDPIPEPRGKLMYA